MAHRAEEKERRRREREEEERKARAAAGRARRLRLVLGAVLAAVLVAVVAVVVAGGSSDDDPSGPNREPDSTAAIPEPGPNATPERVQQAARAAGCTVRSYPEEGRDHVEGEVTYRTNPPTSGPHNAVPAEDGVYAAGEAPPKENLVHTLEHGRILLQYRPGMPERTVDQLETLFNEPLGDTPGYHMVLLENTTNMPYAVAATAWTQLLGCPRMNDRVFDAVRAFRARNTDQAPEQVP